MEKVMNNDDLRRIIWSYFRKTPFRQCIECGCVCMWDENKKINPSVTLGDDMFCCYICFYSNHLLSHPFL